MQGKNIDIIYKVATTEEFSERTRAGKLHAGDVEFDFSAWEQTEILLKHYRSLQTR